MNKEQFKLQAEHNKYMRGIAASVCKIYLWSCLYVFAVWAIMSIATKIAEDEVTKSITSSLSKTTSSDGTAPLIVAGILVAIFSVAFGIFIGNEVKNKIKEHKRISDLEDQYFGTVTPSAVSQEKSEDSIEPEVETDDAEYEEDDI